MSTSNTLTRLASTSSAITVGQRKEPASNVRRRMENAQEHTTLLVQSAAGVLVEQGEIPVFGEDGTEYKEWGIEFSCRFHRSKRDKKLDSDALSDNDRIRKAALSTESGSDLPDAILPRRYFRWRYH